MTSLIILLLPFSMYAKEEKETAPTWTSILVPGLGDYLNNNPKLGTFWLGSTLLIAGIHKNSVDTLHSKKDNYGNTWNYGVFLGKYDDLNTLFTAYKFKTARSDYSDAISNYNQTANILVGWWILNFLSAQINYPRLFEVMSGGEESSFNIDVYPRKYGSASSGFSNWETFYNFGFQARF
ncbi:MAG: hypothetical protein H7A23_00265 [Leptospiraceae bacterium]|nr:hypothetical protein [Leptospiraceae bacterium]MCP5492963.1 hypothetical protein [Leptospiraceae bacterium]